VISLFRDKSIVAILALIILCFIIHSHIFFSSIGISTGKDTGLLSWLLQIVATKMHPIAISLGYIFILLLQAIRLNFILDNTKMFNKPGFTIGFAYILLSGLFVNALFLTPALIANTFIIAIVNSALKLYNNPSPNKLLFNLGFVASISFIMYQPSIILVVSLFFALGILRSFKPSEWFILIIGIVAPIYLLVSSLYLTDHLYLVQKLLPQLQFRFLLNKDPWQWYNLILLFLLTIAGLIVWFPNSNRMVIQIRKSWLVILILFLLSLLDITFFNNKNYAPEVLSMVTQAAFLANFFTYPKKTILINLLLLAAVVALVYNNVQIIPS
jgi:hypothetical protein